jgi:hypothetical protein
MTSSGPGFTVMMRIAEYQRAQSVHGAANEAIRII